MRISNPKDFGAGLIYLILGGSVVLLSQSYPLGTAIKMGPAYFPSVLGALLALIGLISLVRSFITSGQAIDQFAWKPMALVLLSIALFGLMARGAGLIAALFVLVMVSASASVKFQWKSSLALAIGLIAFCALVFVKALGIPLPLVGPWLGG